MITNEQMIIRLIVAAILGSAIGMERERLDRAAGLRTHALVAVGSALVMIVSAFGFRDVHGVSQVVLDPSRVAAQVVSGIGFLGAGTIIVQRGNVKGLTTAASVWAVAAIGLAVGGGLYIASAAATAVILIILIAVKPIEKRITANRNHVVSVSFDPRQASVNAIKQAAETSGVVVRKIVIIPGGKANEDHLELQAGGSRIDQYLKLREELLLIKGIKRIKMPDVTVADNETAFDPGPDES